MLEKNPLEEHLGYWLRKASNHVSGTFAKALAIEGVSVADWVVLCELIEGGKSPSHISERIDMTRGAVTKIVDRLAVKGLLERVSSQQDGRSQEVRLTDLGHALLPKLKGLADANEVQCFGCLDEAEKEMLLMALRKLAAHHDLKHSPTD